ARVHRIGTRRNKWEATELPVYEIVDRAQAGLTFRMTVAPGLCSRNRSSVTKATICIILSPAYHHTLLLMGQPLGTTHVSADACSGLLLISGPFLVRGLGSLFL